MLIRESIRLIFEDQKPNFNAQIIELIGLFKKVNRQREIT